MMQFNIADENANKIGIYCIRNVADDSRYIGQTTESFYKRWIRHSYLLKTNKHFNNHLQNAYNKYGENNFEMFIVEVCNDTSEIDELEEKYIAECKQKHNCYNFLSGGKTMNQKNNPFFGRKHTPESKQKMSKKTKGRNKGENCCFYGQDHSGKNNGFYGHHHTEEAIQKMSKYRSEHYKKENNPFYGKNHSQETWDYIHAKAMEVNCKKVQCVETGLVYISGKEAERQTGISSRRISDVCNGKGKTAGGFHWRFEN